MRWDDYLRYPITYRNWLLKRMTKEIELAHKSNADMTTKGIHHNTPEIRNLGSKVRQMGTTSPALQRFT